MFTNDFPVGEFPVLPPAFVQELQARTVLARRHLTEMAWKAVVGKGLEVFTGYQN